MNRSRTIPAFGLGVFLMRGKDCFSPDGVPPHIHHATYKLFGWMGRSTLNGKNTITCQWPFQGPIDWRYLPYIRPIF